MWRFSLQQDSYTGGMSIPFVDPWERSSISLLGTALMRPGILPFIPHSLQLGTAHSFRYGHSGVFVYTDTMQRAKTAHSPPQSSVSAHTPPLVYLENWYFSGFGVLFSNSRHRGCYVCVCLPQLRKNPLPENTEEGHMVMICRFS